MPVREPALAAKWLDRAFNCKHGSMQKDITALLIPSQACQQLKQTKGGMFTLFLSSKNCLYNTNVSSQLWGKNATAALVIFKSKSIILEHVLRLCTTYKSQVGHYLGRVCKTSDPEFASSQLLLMTCNFSVFYQIIPLTFCLNKYVG